MIGLNGFEATSPEDIGNLAVAHFQSMLGLEMPNTTLSMILQVANMIRTDRFQCSASQATELIKIPLPEDIAKIMFKLNQNKSPGPDGFTSGFYKAAWTVMGSEVTTAITSFFHSSSLPTATNSTILTLLPKFPGASIIKDYRPISCCNTLYKVISKLLVNRLKPLLPSIILPNQTAFIKGRLLTENCLLASEIFSGYHNHRGQKKLTLKIDIAKAFDSVRWDYLTACLRSLNLPNDFIQWLAACYSSPSFSVGINGRLHGFFKGTRGLRQGDPLSPYLFGIVINTLSQKLNAAAESGRIGYHANCRKSNLTHLCFADDLLIFTDGTLSSVQGVLQVLQEFEAFAGLSISVDKSCFFPSGLTELEMDEITQASGISVGSLPIRYLGLPLNSRKLSITNCEPLLQQVRSKINAWTSKYLSFAGRQVLISTVIAGITNFWCGAFILPKECIRAIDKMCNAFLWKGTLEGRYVARVAWDKVTQPKKNGGLGIRNLELWNRTCTIKLLWFLVFRLESVWSSWMRDNVIKDESLWHMKPRQSHTWLFKQLLSERQTAIQWLHIEPGDGTDVSFWSDPWTKFGQLIKFLGQNGPRLTGIPLHSSVADVWRDGGWTIHAARSQEIEELLTYLTTISLSDTPSSPSWIVNCKSSNTFSSASIYLSIQDPAPPVPWFRLIWLKQGIPKHKTMAWLMLLNRCPTRDRLLSWGLQTDPLCLLCNQENESRNHLLFLCPFSTTVWNHFSTQFGLFTPSPSWEDVSHSILSQAGTRHFKYLSILT